LFVSENGNAGALIDVTPVPQQIHILTACDSIFPGASGYRGFIGLPCQPYVTHADGSLVTAKAPAQVGEELVAYAVGLGATSPAVATGQSAAAPAPITQPVALDFNYRLNALATEPQMPGIAPAFAGLTTGFPSLYQVNFTVPPPPVPGQFVPGCSETASPGTVASNLTVSLGGLASFDGAGICIAVPAA